MASHHGNDSDVRAAQTELKSLLSKMGVHTANDLMTIATQIFPADASTDASTPSQILQTPKARVDADAEHAMTTISNIEKITRIMAHRGLTEEELVSIIDLGVSVAVMAGRDEDIDIVTRSFDIPDPSDGVTPNVKAVVLRSAKSSAKRFNLRYSSPTARTRPLTSSLSAPTAAADSLRLSSESGFNSHSSKLESRPQSAILQAQQATQSSAEGMAQPQHKNKAPTAAECSPDSTPTSRTTSGVAGNSDEGHASKPMEDLLPRRRPSQSSSPPPVPIDSPTPQPRAGNASSAYTIEGLVGQLQDISVSQPCPAILTDDAHVQKSTTSIDSIAADDLEATIPRSPESSRDPGTTSLPHTSSPAGDMHDVEMTANDKSEDINGAISPGTAKRPEAVPRVAADHSIQPLSREPSARAFSTTTDEGHISDEGNIVSMPVVPENEGLLECGALAPAQVLAHSPSHAHRSHSLGQATEDDSFDLPLEEPSSDRSTQDEGSEDERSGDEQVQQDEGAMHIERPDEESEDEGSGDEQVQQDEGAMHIERPDEESEDEGSGDEQVEQGEGHMNMEISDKVGVEEPGSRSPEQRFPQSPTYAPRSRPPVQATEDDLDDSFDLRLEEPSSDPSTQDEGSEQEQSGDEQVQQDEGAMHIERLDEESEDEGSGDEQVQQDEGAMHIERPDEESEDEGSGDEQVEQGEGPMNMEISDKVGVEEPGSRSPEQRFSQSPTYAPRSRPPVQAPEDDSFDLPLEEPSSDRSTQDEGSEQEQVEQDHFDNTLLRQPASRQSFVDEEPELEQSPVGENGMQMDIYNDPTPPNLDLYEAKAATNPAKRSAEDADLEEEEQDRKRSRVEPDVTVDPKSLHYGDSWATVNQSDDQHNNYYPFQASSEVGGNAAGTPQYGHWEEKDEEEQKEITLCGKFTAESNWVLQTIGNNLTTPKATDVANWFQVVKAIMCQEQGAKATTVLTSLMTKMRNDPGDVWRWAHTTPVLFANSTEEDRMNEQAKIKELFRTHLLPFFDSANLQIFTNGGLVELCSNLAKWDGEEDLDQRAVACTQPHITFTTIARATLRILLLPDWSPCAGQTVFPHLAWPLELALFSATTVAQLWALWTAVVAHMKKQESQLHHQYFPRYGHKPDGSIATWTLVQKHLDQVVLELKPAGKVRLWTATFPMLRTFSLDVRPHAYSSDDIVENIVEEPATATKQMEKLAASLKTHKWDKKHPKRASTGLAPPSPLTSKTVERILRALAKILSDGPDNIMALIDDAVLPSHLDSLHATRNAIDEKIGRLDKGDSKRWEAVCQGRILDYEIDRVKSTSRVPGFIHMMDLVHLAARKEQEEAARKQQEAKRPGRQRGKGGRKGTALVAGATLATDDQAILQAKRQEGRFLLLLGRSLGWGILSIIQYDDIKYLRRLLPDGEGLLEDVLSLTIKELPWLLPTFVHVWDRVTIPLMIILSHDEKWGKAQWRHLAEAMRGRDVVQPWNYTSFNPTWMWMELVDGDRRHHMKYPGLYSTSWCRFLMVRDKRVTDEDAAPYEFRSKAEFPSWTNKASDEDSPYRLEDASLRDVDMEESDVAVSDGTAALADHASDYDDPNEQLLVEAADAGYT